MDETVLFLICGVLKMHGTPHMLPPLVTLVGIFVLYSFEWSPRILSDRDKVVVEVAQSHSYNKKKKRKA